MAISYTERILLEIQNEYPTKRKFLYRQKWRLYQFSETPVTITFIHNDSHYCYRPLIHNHKGSTRL